MYGHISVRNKFYFTSGKYIERLSKMIDKGYTQISNNLSFKQKKIHTKINTNICTICNRNIVDKNIVLSQCQHIFCCDCLHQIYKQKAEEQKQIQILMTTNKINDDFYNEINNFIYSNTNTNSANIVLDMCLSKHRTTLLTKIPEIKQMTSKTLAYVDIDCPECKSCLVIVP
jgi:hypothetical protein